MKVEIRMSPDDTLKQFQKAVRDFERAGFEVQSEIRDLKIYVEVKRESEFTQSKIGLDKFFDVTERLKIGKGKIFFIA